MCSERPYFAEDKTGGWTPPRHLSAVPPFSSTFRPGRDGLTGGYSVCCRPAVFSSGHDRRSV
ncbi:MAG: hypothetical protein LBJ01_02740, partial [Tannerella sp.]|nr:hypothetical protein [Tannerella sp.]